MKHINDGSGQADRPGFGQVHTVGYRERLMDAYAAAELKVAWARNPEEFEDWVAAANDAAMRVREFDEATLEVEEMMAEGEAEFRLDLHRLFVAETGPNIDLSEVDIEDEKLADFCRGSEVCDWQLLAVEPGFEIGEVFSTRKARQDRLEKAEVSFLEWLTGVQMPAWPYGFETELVQSAGGTV